jgi:hypothetical protein
MNKTLIVACAVAGGLFAVLAAPPPGASPSQRQFKYREKC